MQTRFAGGASGPDVHPVNRTDAPRRNPLSRLAAVLRPERDDNTGFQDLDDQPLRGDLYSGDQLAQHARTLAGWHETEEEETFGPQLLLDRLRGNRRVLEDAYEQVVDAAERGRRVAPAAEWLVDNFYLIEQQLRLAAHHLPRGYATELPRLKSGPNAGKPRVYDLAMELITHVDGQVDKASLSRFVESYQSAAALRQGELWAVPIMLRISLIENLRRVAARVAEGQRDQDAAEHWAERILTAAKRDPKSVVSVLSDMYASMVPPTSPGQERRPLRLSSGFVSEFARRLRGQGPSTASSLEWLGQALADQGAGIDQMAQLESQRQATDQVSIGNSIGSLRFVESHDWSEWVEAQSQVEAALRTDPAEVYEGQTFLTRDSYRHVVERLAKHGPYSERQVAELAVGLAREGGTPGPREAADADVKRHIGHYLIGEARPKLDRVAGTRSTFGSTLRAVWRAAPLEWFLGTATLLALVGTLAVSMWSASHGMPWWAIIAMILPIFIAASQPAVAFVNWLVTKLAAPKALPRMRFEDGIPASCRTVVVVPTMLSSPAAVDDVVAGLEVRHLANPDQHLHFCLLSDLPDADEEVLDGDEELIARAAEQIKQLNEQYGAGEGEKFMLLHRPRKWNESEGAWMGWERKRGKLAEFNALLRPAGRDGDKAIRQFSHTVCKRDVLFDVEYVIALDGDTELPRDTARQLVATIDHPLNRPIYDPVVGRVTSGYGILQPRVGVDLPSASASLFSRVMSGEPGVDPYTNAVSDVYQDAFGEGSFIGKGIYHPATFEKACADNFPENAILSHDLIESAFARSGLVTDVVLYEDHPSSYAADVARRTRWVRGDWQLIAYLLPWLRREGGWIKNPTSGLSRWKLLDNLRRSLVPIAVLAVLIIAFIAEPSAAWAWALLSVGYFFGPLILKLSFDAFAALFGAGDEERPAKLRVGDVWQSSRVGFARSAMSLALLPYEAFVHTVAIVKTLYRLWFSRRHLLEWTTAAEAERKARLDHASFWEAMWPAWMVAVGVIAWLIGSDHYEATIVATLTLALWWAVSPTLAFVMSRPIKRKAPREMLVDRDRRFLRKVGRRTWSFFDRYVAAADNYLPPDNVQELPNERIAPRTSPTNIGLALLSNVAAHDFGYITLGQLLDRTQRTLNATGRLERHETGHLFNWYDTRRLEPLTPRYVSSVDSGNFVASVRVLELALDGLVDEPVIGPQAWPGVADVVRLLLDTCRDREQTRLEEDDEPQLPPSRVFKLPPDLERRLERIASDCDAGGPSKLGGAKMFLQTMSIVANEAVAATRDAPAEASRWAQELQRQVSRFADELHHLCPWVDLVGPSRPYAGGDGSSRGRLAVIEKALLQLDNYPSLRDVAKLADEVVPAARALVEEVDTATIRPHADLPYFQRLARILGDASDRAASRVETIKQLKSSCLPLRQADWSLLYDRSRNLLHIGYDASERRKDAGYYDLLASEMRLASFALVADGTLPQEHWFALGRQTTRVGRHEALLSWSGSMFEYLMPLLVMPTYSGTLLDETYTGVVDRQIEYARSNGINAGVPWGVSESGYSTTDAELTYQYRPFGVPGLGFKRGLGEDLVIAPYASMMAAMVNPPAAAKNLRRLRDEGKMGRFGFYEAIDYTPARIKRDRKEAIVRQWMAHHQAMGFLGFANLLLDGPMQKRMAASADFKSGELMLHERVPRGAHVFPHTGEHAGSRRAEQQAVGILRTFNKPDQPTPEVHLLGNGRLATMVSTAGGGYTRWDDGDGKTLAVTRWNEDAVRDCWGTFVYLRDLDTGTFWSNAYQPTLREPQQYEAIFSQARAEYRRVDRLPTIGRDGKEDDASSGPSQSPGDDIETYTQISVSPEDDVEVRRVVITNRGRKTRTIELTSYAEPVLADPRADAAHPAFQNLFVQTRLVRGRQAILAKRRARGEGERTPYAVHLVTLHGTEVGDAQYETDRGAFVGRGRSLVDPAAMHNERLADTNGSVLDPIVSVRRVVKIGPGERARFDVVTGIADGSEAAHALIEKYHDRRLCDRVSELAWTHSQVVLRQLGIDEADAQAYGRLAGSVIYATPQRRADASVIARNLDLNRKQSNLWAYGISGDLPVVLVRVGDHSKVAIVEEAVRAHAYWRRKGLQCDLVVWNEDTSGYRAEVNDAIMAAVSRAGSADLLDRPGGIFVRRGEQFPDEDKVLIQTIARITLVDSGGRLIDQIERRMSVRPLGVSKLVSNQGGRNTSSGKLLPSREIVTADEIVGRRGDLLFNNGSGGFTPDGKEYVVVHDAAHPTPAPWSNVMANPTFGTIVTESGGGYTWRTNAREFRLTPFYNDPVGDTSGEALYLRDEESGRFWSPMGAPARGNDPVTTRHGFGYSIFETSEQALRTETAVYVHRDEPTKFVAVKVHNTSDRRRKASLWYYAEWVLTDQRAAGAMHVVTSLDPKSGAVLARNPYNSDFGSSTAFLQCSESRRSVTGDRLEFLGRNHGPSNPAALGREKLSGKVGAGLDPCAAMCVPVDLGPGEEKEVVFTIGAGDNEQHAIAMANRFSAVPETKRALEDNWEFWSRTLGSLYIDTPDPAVNVLANGWLEYQALSCRYWGRSGYYQSGGAYGFRDQLQDVAALLWCTPHLIREQLLRAAAHQFVEGDVLHWWHPPVGRGVRTHFSDDYMWLPLICARYVKATGDTGVLEERAPLLTGEAVPLDQESVYKEWANAAEDDDLYGHCKRSILNGIDNRGYGQHGLPLMGCGDWNDGMNLIGEHHKGESVWLGWFFIETLLDFAPLADARGDADFAKRCRDEAETLRANVEREAWDGDWYRRAYFDNGEPLGSSTNPECQIDSLPQSWAVLCGKGNPDRAAQGMKAVEDRLVRRDKGLIQLFDPPFDDSHLEPGYIKGYVPGVRENGGQYTHAAVWTVMAYAKLGDARRAWELFDLINPVNHAVDHDSVQKYRVEPYVAAADVYGVSPHVGRGGWTWYTGSAGWMFRLIVESLLGITLKYEEGENGGEHRLYLAPLLPEGWDNFGFTYRHKDTHHNFRITRPSPASTPPAIASITIDGKPAKTDFIRLLDDAERHEIVVTLE